jgi:hypothetical protein
MHDKKAYEQTITSKLEALPVPDMADAIWARIEAQLDLDMPEDDGGGNNNPSSSPRMGWPGKLGIILFVAALVTTFFLSGSRKNTVAPGTTITNKNLVNDTASGSNSGSALIELVQGTGAKAPVQTRDASANVLDTSLNQLTISSPGITDTIQQYTGDPAPQVQTVADTTPPKPQGRGVRGIRDDDYRIKPKNDSTP